MKKLLIIGTMPIILDMNADSSSDSEEEEIGETEETTQKPITCLISHDECYVAPQLLNELYVEIFARVPCSEYWKLQFLNKRFSQLLKSSEIFRMRQKLGLVKPYLFLLSSGANRWTMFDKDFESFLKLPKLSSNICFFNGDKEVTSVGTQLIVIGKEVEGITVWRFELEMQKWVKGPAMITPRVMFGSASHGTNAFFAGGVKIDKNSYEVVSIAEKYNAETKTWTAIHAMHKRRKLCSGFFLRGKFYVLGGQNENDEYLTCAESYNEVTDSWELIPNMLKDMPVLFSQAPPRIAVVNDNLYLLETSLNELHVYDVNANAWKKLGVVPVGAHFTRGWGVAFKSVGDELLVIGASSARPQSQSMTVYKCRPDVEEIVWEECKRCCRGVRLNHFILNCCVMLA
ncbi:hypothetical protein EUTSA_v10005262mg [Eutrema salsugineum]|uniref:F-box domain-containing protein n=2 Tax=Eutrema salsugineum TaxID=72664 RepID=V4L0D9_EUTSA|nr:hypothetical protein EUTSA_v10005262mg [Eutrema salsugineum]